MAPAKGLASDDSGDAAPVALGLPPGRATAANDSRSDAAGARATPLMLEPSRLVKAMGSSLSQSKF
jgi:hypothetical protein